MSLRRISSATAGACFCCFISFLSAPDRSQLVLHSFGQMFEIVASRVVLIGSVRSTQGDDEDDNYSRRQTTNLVSGSSERLEAAKAAASPSAACAISIQLAVGRPSEWVGRPARRQSSTGQKELNRSAAKATDDGPTKQWKYRRSFSLAWRLRGSECDGRPAWKCETKFRPATTPEQRDGCNSQRG